MARSRGGDRSYQTPHAPALFGKRGFCPPLQTRHGYSSTGARSNGIQRCRCGWTSTNFPRFTDLPPEHAIELYSGDLLADFDDEWIDVPRTRLRERKAALLFAQIECKRASADLLGASECARHLLEDDPWREDAVRELISLLEEGGNRAGAIHAYLDFRQRLKAELGGEPMAETSALYQRMTAEPALGGGGTMSARLRSNLPAPLAPLIARARELGEIEALLHESRLVTVTGCGGIGKTRTALEAGSHLLGAFDDGVWLVELASLDDPLLVPSAIAAVFNVSDAGESRPLIDRIASMLAEKRLLIVLDNCEHVIGAAAGAVERLLQQCPAVRVLATSRQSLGAAGEEQYRLPSLLIPPAGETTSAARAMEFGAVVLFAARAKSARRSFTLTDANAGLVADIVRRLDGIALAIEMAAARVAVLSLEQLAAPARRSLRALVGRRSEKAAAPRNATGAYRLELRLCSANPSASCSDRSRCSEEPFDWKRLRRFARAIDCPRRTRLG